MERRRIRDGENKKRKEEWKERERHRGLKGDVDFHDEGKELEASLGGFKETKSLA